MTESKLKINLIVHNGDEMLNITFPSVRVGRSAFTTLSGHRVLDAYYSKFVRGMSDLSIEEIDYISDHFGSIKKLIGE